MTVRERELHKVVWSAASAHRLEEVEERLASLSVRGLAPPFVPFSPRNRSDPASVMPGARSVLVFAVPYGHRHPSGGVGASPRGAISRSAWGEDYHPVVQQVIERLLPGIVGASTARRAYIQVDTGPLEERAWARRAGLGWLGQNTCIAVPPHGSWVFLGLAVVDEEVKAPAHSRGGSTHCLECGRCVEACPTGALMAPYSMNPQRCLSFISQRRGFLPQALRRALGDRLYGCDSCQEACPVNEDAARGLKAFAPEDMDVGVDPYWILGMDEREFQLTWGGKSSGWRGRRTLQRNALIVCGNCGDESDVELIAPHFDDRRPVIREHALWAVREILRRSESRLPRRLQECVYRLARTDDWLQVRFSARQLLKRTAG